MPIILPGTLNIKVIKGRKGDFNVGSLVTELAEFVVKDSIDGPALIENFEEGSYTGTFTISKIFPACYTAGTRIFAEIRAKVIAFEIDDAQEGSMPAMEIPVQDPSDETPSKPTQEQTPAPDDDADRALFGDLYPLADSVQIDPTTNRALFMRQKEALKRRLGYDFHSQTQTWLRAGSDAHKALFNK